MAKFDNTVLMINKAEAGIEIDRDPNFDDMKLIFDGVTATGPYALAPGKQVHVGSTYGADMGVCLTYSGDERYMDLGLDPESGSDSKVFSVISDSEDDGNGPLAYELQDQTAVSMTMVLSRKFKNTVLMINKARAGIEIDRDPNFDDMKLIFDGVAATGPYALAPGKQVHVGSSYGTDMGVVLTYNGDDRSMEIGMGPDSGTDYTVFTVISDSESGGGPLTYDAQDQTAVSMTMTFHDKA